MALAKNDDATKKILSIYKIDKDEFSDEFDTNDKIINHIVSAYKEWKYLEETLDRAESNGYKLRLFYHYQDISYQSWWWFFEWYLPTENFLIYLNSTTWEVHDKKGCYLSFVTFFEKEESIYAFCVWKWYLLVERWAEQYFWFDVITRLLSPKSKAIHQLTNNGLTWSNFETSSIFRTGQSFLSQDDFGKIIKEAIAELDKDALLKIGIEKSNKTNCIAKTHFTLKSGISLDDLTKNILPNIEDLLKKKNVFLINQIEEIKKAHPSYIAIKEALKMKLYEAVWEFDFFPPKDALWYFSAHKYELLWEEKNFSDDSWHMSFIISQIRSRGNGGTFEDFQNDLSTVVRAMDENGHPVMHWFSMIRCLHGELEYDWEKYFWLNWKIWKINSTAIEQFNSRCWKAFDNHSFERMSSWEIDCPIPFNEFDLSVAEGPYNRGHKDTFLVLDAKLVDNIELCDLLYQKDDTLYIIHVKKWFDRDVRVLSSQLLMSARLISEYKQGWDKDFMERVADKVLSEWIATREVFLELFNSKKIVFVLAFAYEKKLISEDDIKKVGSNIAKLEIFETTKVFKDFNPPFDLKIIQLPSK